MKKLFGILILVSLMAVFINMVFAIELDDQGNPNNPHDNARANACFNGGAMAGKCDDAWEWECGWFMIRYDAGVISPSDFPTACSSLLERPATALPEDNPLPTSTPLPR
jgi:hypothetical protein